MAVQSLAQHGQASEICLCGGVVTGEIRIPPPDSFDDGSANTEDLGGTLAFVRRVGCVETSGRITRMSAKAQAAQLSPRHQRLFHRRSRP